MYTLSFSTDGSFLICFVDVDEEEEEEEKDDDDGGVCCTTCTFRFNDGTLFADLDDIQSIYLKKVRCKIKCLLLKDQGRDVKMR